MIIVTSSFIWLMSQKGEVMKNEIIEDVVKGLSEVSVPVDVDKTLEQANKVIDIENELEEIERIIPKDAYDKKNEAIENADIPLNEKLALFDQNDKMRLENYEKAIEMHDKIRDSKIIRFFKVVFGIAALAAIGAGGYQVYQNSSNNPDDKEDDIYDSDDYMVS